MRALTKGRYRVRLAGEADLADVFALRARLFRGDASAADTDSFDARAMHVVVEDLAAGKLACAFRLLRLTGGEDIATGYTSQFYDTAPLAGYAGPVLEMGRFCIDPAFRGDPHVLRTAWVGMTDYIDSHGVRFLFGCSSFHGIDPVLHMDALALLRARHTGPAALLPQVKAAKVQRFADLPAHTPDKRNATLQMPPLLRSFLMLGGWVSDHAVVDDDLGTLHVFTGLEIEAIPPNRAAAFRATV
ncbi:GNAT family N-acetyltransferase [Vannielia litorea]|uniref:GNAT family N-acetyltransferase n=1 Tax=Vannielia litorea TaxID=1217970 RepID=UPI001BCB4469|nr:GNAT family N-acetyltransferase [Vannielia litorea]MBS8225241.1 GNAT family N-acetyltransferase [Vannielia litorea]